MFTDGKVSDFCIALGAIAAYCFFEKKPAIELEFVNDGQLQMF